MAHGVPARLTRESGRKFGLTVGIAFLAFAALLTWRGHEPPAIGAGTAGALLILAGLGAPTRLGPVYRGWMAFGLAISKVTTPLFMGIVYFLVMTPIGLMARAFGHRPLAAGRGRPSAWIHRGDGPSRRSDLERQF